MYCDLWPKESKIEQQTGQLLATLQYLDLIYFDFRFKDSEYVTTMLVVVPLNLLEDWYAKYESLTDMVVPRETSMIFQDSDHALMTVSLFHQVKNY